MNPQEEDILVHLKGIFQKEEVCIMDNASLHLKGEEKEFVEIIEFLPIER